MQLCYQASQRLGSPFEPAGATMAPNLSGQPVNANTAARDGDAHLHAGRLGEHLNEVSDGKVLAKIVAAESAPRVLGKVLVDGRIAALKEEQTFLRGRRANAAPDIGAVIFRNEEALRVHLFAEGNERLDFRRERVICGMDGSFK